ncbi:MAG: ABC transporter substrate-binding protein [Anaerolineae bacterium]|nr:ABC transporter substrate-binding protein [Anaerolineae bacterium]
MKKFSALLVILLVATIITGPACAQEEDVLIFATGTDDLITLDPGWAYESTNLTIHHAAYDTLLNVSTDDLSKIVPNIAKGYEMSEDGLVYTFTLREGLEFASGNPITAEDVRFSWTRLINLKGNPSFYADPIAAIEVVDDLTVEVTLKEPFPAFPAVTTTPAMSILDSAVVIEHGGTDAEDAAETDTAKDWLDQNSAGSGPFILTGWVPNAEVTLVRNDNYWGKPPAFARVIIRDVNDANTALQQLERGDIDITDFTDPDLIAQILANPDLEVAIGQSLNLNYLAMSPAPSPGAEGSEPWIAPLWEKKVRQAIAYSIDYTGILDGLLQGYADRPAAMLPLGVQGSDPSARYERDVEKAKALLAEAGYPDGFGGLVLSIGTGAPGGVPNETIAAKIVADLAEVGIQVTVEQQPTSNFLTAYRAQELQFLFAGWTPDYLDATMWSDYFSYPDAGPAYRIQLDSETIADLATQAAFETDPDTRTELYTQYQNAHVDEAVFVPVIQAQSVYAMRTEITGFAYNPVYFIDFYSITRAGE